MHVQQHSSNGAPMHRAQLPRSKPVNECLATHAEQMPGTSPLRTNYILPCLLQIRRTFQQQVDPTWVAAVLEDNRQMWKRGAQVL